MRAVLRRWTTLALLGASPAALATESALPSAVQAARPERIDPADPESEILYRQLDLWHYRRNRDRIEEILDRLWAGGSERYCGGLARLGDNHRLSGDRVQAAAWYRRAIRECAAAGWAMLGLAEMAQAEPRLCPQALAATTVDLPAAGKVAFAAAEPGWTRDELDYLGVVGASVIRMTCGDGALDARDLDRIVAFRGSRSFGGDAGRMEPYVRAMMRADLELRAGRPGEAQRHLRDAVTEACRARDALQTLVDAAPREGDDPLAFPVGLGAVGLLRELWARRMLEGLEGGAARCLQEMLHTLRRQFRTYPEMDRPEVRDWYADLDRRLRRDRE
jgi:hypothetical protein